MKEQILVGRASIHILVPFYHVWKKENKNSYLEMSVNNL
jgi:hypothetical protein